MSVPTHHYFKGLQGDLPWVQPWVQDMYIVLIPPQHLLSQGCVLETDSLSVKGGQMRIPGTGPGGGEKPHIAGIQFAW